MTHSLHRIGTDENLSNDYIVFAMSGKGVNDINSGPKMREFFAIAKKHNPINMGDMKSGNWFVIPEEKIEENIQDTSIVHAVYTDMESVSAFMKELIEADLGLSIVVSGLLGPIKTECQKQGLNPAPHTVEYSLGIFGKTALLPSDEVLEVSTMCGHGQVAFGLIKDAIAEIKSGRTTPAKAAKRLSETCVCGIFNPVRAAELLQKMAD
ncbi:hypothetical protein KJ742_03560 [Patescibacteria group bacterium]|nr:hypothetical protein [Patescibacteria group bacterium]